MRILRSIFLLGLILAGCTLRAQTRVQLRLQTAVPTSVQDSIFLAGSFNGWNPADPRYRFQVLVGPDPTPQRTWTLELKLPPGRHEFKITRGGWDRVETTRDGGNIENRILEVRTDSSLLLSVENWADRFAKKEKRSTALPQVRVIDTAFFIPQLSRHRRVWIYLPADYASSRKAYPVLYMHDGQNVFDEKTSGFGEWGVDEALDTLEKELGGLIVVAVDHGGERRLNEYAPYDMQRFGKGEGEAYVRFLVKTLKPYIDKNYRTKRGRKHTSIAGSSMGGLISFYAHLHYPRVFGRSGVFSPAFWINPQFRTADRRRARRVKGGVYFYAGTAESTEMVPDMLIVHNWMRLHSRADLRSVIRAEARHNEGAWRKELPEFFQWLLR